MTSLAAALTIYTRHHPQPDPAQLATIERLITAEGAAFNLARWTRLCARIAAKRLRSRADLVVADYRRSRGAPVLNGEQAAAYEVLRSESEQAEAERGASGLAKGWPARGRPVESVLGIPRFNHH